ncbi:MAG TPA: hypothetical protein DG577_09665 [Firmicutes bacterium]|jgi:transcriptional regulator with XRE-family HTH domain|uniref:helix-turn-helix domain-containing protein n=1 Tax=Alkalibaculum bacchi TaxID=645887 RepID=UPI000EBFA8DC|nr:helix-turn-helix transcriptional regulator [Alkalibaculum bacchi]HCX79667.1 hypothetical protein [Bacillota bacterium]
MLEPNADVSAVYGLVRRNLKRLRKEHQLTQTAVAQRIGITVQYYQQMESGKKVTQIKTIAKLCKAFNIHPSYFFFDEDLELVSRDGKVIAENLSTEAIAVIKNATHLSAEAKDSVIKFIRFKKFEAAYGQDWLSGF